MSYLDDAAENTAAFEGKIPFMYLDSAKPANVTAAIGLMLANLDAALALPWYITDFSRSATAKEIASEFARVKKSQPGFTASYYKWAASLMLTDVDMLHMLKVELGAIDAQLAATYSTYTAWPEPAKLATLDMAYNLGLGELRTGYPVFNHAASEEDWLTCAGQCHRNGPGIARNTWTAQQFSQAYSMKVAA
jgi:hypothetical protein